MEEQRGTPATSPWDWSLLVAVHWLSASDPAAEPPVPRPAAFLHGTVESGEITQMMYALLTFLTLKPEQIIGR